MSTATFTVTGSHLHDAAAWASRVVPARPTTPLLGGLLLEAGDDLTVSAFDYETAVSATVDALATQPGRVLLSARLLTAIAKTVARDVDVTIEAGPSGAVARCGRSEWSLPVLDADDYPALPDLADPIGTVDADVLRHAIGRVVPCVHSGDKAAVQNLTGVKVDSDGTRLRLVATDRYRVGEAVIDWKPGDPPGFQLDALVPGELLDIAVKASRGGTVTLYGNDATFGLATDTHRVAGRQVAAKYPDLSRFMPEPGTHRAVVDVADLARAVDEAVVMLEREPAVTLAFGADTIELSVNGDDRKARTVAGLHSLDGDPVTVALNAGFLRTALRLVESDAAVACFTNRTVLFYPSGADGAVVDGYRHLVMRTRLG